MDDETMAVMMMIGTDPDPRVILMVEAEPLHLSAQLLMVVE